MMTRRGVETPGSEYAVMKRHVPEKPNIGHTPESASKFAPTVLSHAAVPVRVISTISTEQSHS